MLEWIYNYETEKQGKPMNLNYGTRKNDSPLMNAANNGELETVKWLYEVSKKKTREPSLMFFLRKEPISITLARALALPSIERLVEVILKLSSGCSNMERKLIW